MRHFFLFRKALNFAIEQEVDVINLGLSGPPDSANVARELIVTTAQPGVRAANACRALARLAASGAAGESECPGSPSMQAIQH